MTSHSFNDFAVLLAHAFWHSIDLFHYHSLHIFFSLSSIYWIMPTTCSQRSTIFLQIWWFKSGWFVGCLPVSRNYPWICRWSHTLDNHRRTHDNHRRTHDNHRGTHDNCSYQQINIYKDSFNYWKKPRQVPHQNSK